MKIHPWFAASLFFSAATVFALDWPQYRGPSVDGHSPESVVLPLGGAAPRTVWKTAIEGGFSSLAIAGGRVFTLSLKEDGGVKQESLVALDAKTGRELWFSPLNFAKYDGGGDAGASDNKGGDGPRSTPASDGPHVFATSSQLTLRAFDAATGHVLWTHDLLKEFGGHNIQWQNAASPVVEGGLVFVAGGGTGQSLLALNALDGQVVWKAFDEKITHATPTIATILGQRQVIFYLQSGLLAVEPKTGRELWRYRFDYKISAAASPVVAGDIVYCSAGYGVGAGAVRLARDPSGWTATELFRMRGNKPLGNHWSTPVALGDYLYGMFQFKEYASGPVKCVDVKTGQVKWEQAGFGPGQVIAAKDRIVALSDQGELVVFAADPMAYKELARAKILAGKCWSAPALSNGQIFARSTTEAVCVDVGAK